MTISGNGPPVAGFEPNGHGPSPRSNGRGDSGAGRNGWRLLDRRRSLILAAAMLAFVVAAVVSGYLRDRGWVRIASIDQLTKTKVIYVSNLGLFVVADAPAPLALLASSPHLREPLLFCRSAQVFQDEHGDLFDHVGVYVAGPSPRGMDRVEVRIRGGFVDVKPGSAITGPARWAIAPQPVVGPACSGTVESPPGFFAQP